MKSIVNILSDDRFPRVRVGIGKPKYDDDIINYVIGPIPDEEIDGLNQGVEKAKDAVIEILKNGIDSAMNKFN
jgi:PTH1 family peptidyl-tRNA hydrolase